MVAPLYYRITQHRSSIGLGPKIVKTLVALGLRHTGYTVYQKVTPISAGMIFRVKELVKVQIVTEPKTRAEEHLARKSNPGYIVEL